MGAVGSFAQTVHIVEDAQDVAALFFLDGVDLLVLDDGIDESADAVDDEFEAEDDETPSIVKELPVGSIFSLNKNIVLIPLKKKVRTLLCTRI